MKLTRFVVISVVAGLVAGCSSYGTDDQELQSAPIGNNFYQEMAYESAADRTLGFYEVQYWLVQKGPWPAPSLLSQTIKFYYKQTPTLPIIKEVVRIPEFVARRKYTFCDDCPISVTVLRPPYREGADKEWPLPEKPPKKLPFEE